MGRTFLPRCRRGDVAGAARSSFTPTAASFLLAAGLAAPALAQTSDRNTAEPPPGYETAVEAVPGSTSIQSGTPVTRQTADPAARTGTSSQPQDQLDAGELHPLGEPDGGGEDEAEMSPTERAGRVTGTGIPELRSGAPAGSGVQTGTGGAIAAGTDTLHGTGSASHGVSAAGGGASAGSGGSGGTGSSGGGG